MDNKKPQEPYKPRQNMGPYWMSYEGKVWTDVSFVWKAHLSPDDDEEDEEEDEEEDDTGYTRNFKMPVTLATLRKFAEKNNVALDSITVDFDPSRGDMEIRATRPPTEAEIAEALEQRKAGAAEHEAEMAKYEEAMARYKVELAAFYRREIERLGR
jgi:hypothetical protein